MAEAVRCGRRKQANPRRKNVDEEGGEENTTTNTNNENGVEQLDTSETENNGTEEQLDNGTDTQTDETDTQTDSDKDSQEENTDKVKSKDSDMKIDETSSEAPETNGNCAENEAESIDSMIGYHDNYNNALSEELKIRELLRRGDTAVIFPEAADEQTEVDYPLLPYKILLNNNNNNDEVGSIDGECLLNCSHCESNFSKLCSLRDHLSSAHGFHLEKHVCSKCGADFSLKSQLEKHLSLHSPTSQVCRVCHKTFANVYRLQRHMISHDESTDLRKFKCPECGKAFKFKHHLKEHIRIHSGEKPFECGNCGKRFSHSGSYSSHMTSKKCWVVNMKIRNGKSDPSIKVNGDHHNEENLRPKGESNGVDIQNVTALYAAGQYPQPFMQFDPTGAHLSQYVAAQMNAVNGARSFLPYAYTTNLLNSMIPGLHGNAYNFGVRGDKEQKLDAKLVEALQAQQEKKEEKSIKEEVVSKTDENQNNETSRDQPEEDVAEKYNEEEAKESEENEKMEVETDSEEVKTNPDMAAVKQILQTIDATVNHQQQEKDDKTAISRLGPEEERQLEGDENCTNLTCRYCKTTYNSPVELHQHERYLCKHNQEIQAGRSGKTNGEVSPTREVPEPKLPEDDAASEASSSNEREGRQYHVRSWFSEEQRNTLREHYKSNPRPDKLELTQLALQLGLPKRVVQVWFQNTRAQDRRKGIPIPPASATKGNSSSSPWSSSSSSTKVPSTPYIPIVPQVPFNSVPTTHPVYYASKANGHVTTTASIPTASSYSPALPSSTFNMQMEPLDLSVKKSDSSSPSRGSSDEIEEGVGVLNLSKKPCSDSIKDSAVVKLMLQEGLMPEDHVSNHSSSSTPVPPRSRELTPVASPHSQDLVVYPHGSPYLNSPGHDSCDLGSPPNSLESSFNSSFSLDSLNGSKRARKKSWRQMESEEGTMDMEDDSLLIDEDEPMRRKRKSWKQHKLDCEEGIYACDQCDKMFNKQSSLARHKYEHSGQRPFACDMCSKAFKHKHHLTEHKRLHSGEKPFQCRKCGKRFSHSGSYSQHMNHRYKYCKPLVMGQEDDEEPEQEPEETMNSMNSLN